MPPEDVWDKLNESIKVEYKIKSGPNGELYIENSDGSSTFLNTNVAIDLSGYATQQAYKRQYNSNEWQTIDLGEGWGENYINKDRNKSLLDKKILNDFFNFSAPKQFLEDGDFDSLYEAFEKYLTSENYNRSNLYILTALLLCSDVDFIPYLGNLTTNMFYGVSLNDKQRFQCMERRKQLVANPNCELSSFNEDVYTNHRYGGRRF